MTDHDDRLQLRTPELGTVLAALEWWAGRKGPIPRALQHHFDHVAPLPEEDLTRLIERLRAGASHEHQQPL